MPIIGGAKPGPDGLVDPVSRGKTPLATTSSAPTDPGGTPPHVVLVVDDEPLLRLDAVGALQEAGCRAFEASQSEEALEMIARHPEISVLFTDVNMPGARDGFALAGEIHKRCPLIQVIVTSGQEHPSPEQIPSGGQFIAKPYDIDAVARIVCGLPRKAEVDSRQYDMPVAMDASPTARRNNVVVRGAGEQVIVFAHGFGCDQNMWRHVAPCFESQFRTLLFDNVGAGQSDLSAYDAGKYAHLEGYADDLVEILRDQGMRDVIFVGHSVSSMIGLLASLEAPELFSSLIFVGPSPRYIDDDGYVGGFSAGQIEELLDFLASNPMAWSRAMAPRIMANADRPELGEELADSFCRTDPRIAEQFARVTFTSDNRADLRRSTIPTLILQCSEDIIAPLAVGDYVHAQMPNSELVVLNATGHCPNLSAPDEVVSAMRAFV